MLGARPDYATELRCPYCAIGWLVEVAPGGYQCWQCMPRPAILYSDLIQHGNRLVAVFVSQSHLDAQYLIGEATWETDFSGHTQSRDFGKRMVLSPDDLDAAPCPIVFPFPTPLPEKLRLQLMHWRPEWFSPSLYGVKEFSL